LLATWKAAEATPIPTAPEEFDRFERALASPQRTDAAVVEYLVRVLAEQRRAEDTLGARRLRPVVHAQIEVIDELAIDAREPVRRELLAVSSHYCQFAGWLGQDTMDAAGARRYYNRAMDSAQEIGDADMVTSVLSLKSHHAWSRGDAATAVSLAQAGQRDLRRVSDAVLALIAQQEARGHALGGDAEATERALDQSATLTYTAAEHPDDAPPWVYFNDPSRLAFQRGVAYVELGRHPNAVPLLSTALGSLTNGYTRDKARYAAMLALALAGAGEVEAALVHAKRGAALAVATGSALAVRELRRVRAALRGHRAEHAMTELAEYLHALTAAD
jgi:tetratricopeptide (TPR) repeat protein